MAYIKLPGLLPSVFLVLLLLTIASSQELKTRTCSASDTVTASRSALSSTTAASRCYNYCANSGQNSTSLYSYFCPKSSSSCGISSYYQVTPTNTTCGVPTLANAGNITVLVPCAASYAVIDKALLNVTGAATSCGPYFFNKEVVASSAGDYSTAYLTVNADGTISRTNLGPNKNIDQSIKFTVASSLYGYYSNSVTINFQYQSCALQVVCPPSFTYCMPSTGLTTLPPATGPFLLTCQITTPLPAGASVVWDDEGNLGATLSQKKAGIDPTCTGAGDCLNSPLVINGTDAVGIFISNYNTIYATDVTQGIYHLSLKDTPTATTVPSPGPDQYLLISVHVAGTSIYSVGSTVVHAIPGTAPCAPVG